MDIVRIKVARLSANTGQIAGLPRNPRQWTEEALDRLKASLAETPELFEARPCLVYPHGSRFVVLGGNMRLEAAKALGYDEVPCIVFPEETQVDKLKEIVIKDNGSTFGSWDWDALANEWDELDLEGWGVPAWDDKKVSPDDFGDEFTLPDGEGPASNQITFYFAAEQKEFVENALDKAEEGEDNYGNDNRNGNKLYQIVKEWVEQRKS